MCWWILEIFHLFGLLGTSLSEKTVKIDKKIKIIKFSYWKYLQVVICCNSIMWPLAWFQGLSRWLLDGSGHESDKNWLKCAWNFSNTLGTEWENSLSPWNITLSRMFRIINESVFGGNFHIAKISPHVIIIR